MYSMHLSSSLRGHFPVLERVMAGQKPPPATNNRVTQLSTHAFNTFKSFAKYSSYNKDLYSDLVAPTLETGLLVESWRNGPNPMPSNCSPPHYRSGQQLLDRINFNIIAVVM